MKKLIVLALSSFSVMAFGQDYAAGEKIFKANCAACHKMDTKVIGPPLQNTVDEQGLEWTKKWIYNNEELRASGDAHANAIYEEYNRQVMPAYSYLSDEELTNLVTYLGEWKGNQSAPAVAVAGGSSAESGETVSEAPKMKRELSSGGKVVLGVLVFATLMITLTIFTLYRAFTTMVEVNKELHKKRSA